MKKDVQTKNNLIVALRPYIKGELIVTQATTPPKSAKKSKPEHKKYRKKQQPEEEEPELEVPEDSNTIKRFLHKSDLFRQLYYSVYNGDVGNVLDILPKRHYTLLMADIPSGFQISGSTYDDVAYKYPQIENMVKELWRIVIFHSMGQALSVTIALKSRCHATEHMHW